MMPKSVDWNTSTESRAFTFHCAVTALEAIRHGVLDPAPRITALATTMCLSLLGEAMIDKFTRALDTQLKDPAKMTVLSYHDTSGNVIVGTTVPGGDNILLDVGDPLIAQAVATRRSADVRFARVSCALNFDQQAEPSHRPCTASMTAAVF